MATLPSASTSLLPKAKAQAACSAPKVVLIEKIFDLDDLLAAGLADADIANLMDLQPNLLIVGASIETVVAQVGGTGTCTLALRFGTTVIATALSMSAIGGPTLSTAAQVPITNGATANWLNVVAAVGGGAITTNPTIKVQVVAYDLN